MNLGTFEIRAIWVIWVIPAISGLVKKNNYLKSEVDSPYSPCVHDACESPAMFHDMMSLRQRALIKENGGDNVCILNNSNQSIK
jgi:hypothetical protein